MTIITKYHNEILCNCILHLVLTMVVQSVTLQIQGTNVRTKQINKAEQMKEWVTEMKILCVGMMVCDTIISPVPDDVLSKDSVMIEPPVLSCGGDALNTAIGLAKLSCDVTMAGKTGVDSNGAFLIEQCRHYGVHTDGVIRDGKCSTACSYALVDMEGERHFLSEVSIFHQFGADEIPDELIQKADLIYVGSVMAMNRMDNGGIQNLFERAHRFKKITVMDAAMNDSEICDWNKVLPPIFKETDIFFPSMIEASFIAGTDQINQIREKFSESGIRYLGIKLGGKGCYVTDFTEEQYISCLKNMPVVDTSGAGDSFMAGLICALSHGKSFFEAARFGSLIGSLNVGKKGATGGIPSYDEAMEIFNQRTDM